MKLLQKTLLLSLLSTILASSSCIAQSKPELIEFNSSECKEGTATRNLRKFQNRILEADLTPESHSYKVFVVANCESNSQGNIEFKNDTLYLKYYGKREFVATKTIKTDSTEITIEEWEEVVTDCNCAYELSYKIKGIKSKDYTIVANNQVINKTNHRFRIIRKEPTFKMLNNDTINYVDIYGLQQGLHIEYRKDGKLYAKINYSDGEKLFGLAKTFYDFDGFDKVETYIENRKFTIRKYYKNEELIKVCTTEGDFDEGTNCKYFN